MTMDISIKRTTCHNNNASPSCCTAESFKVAYRIWQKPALITDVILFELWRFCLETCSDIKSPDFPVLFDHMLELDKPFDGVE